MAKATILFILFLFFLIAGCEKQCENDFYNYKNAYPDYMLVPYLGGRGNGLELINSENWREEGLYFNESNCLAQYVFFNAITHESRFIINYAETSAEDSVWGKSLYLESTIFNRNFYVKDSFEVSIHIATPPTHYSIFKIFKMVRNDSLYFINSDTTEDNSTIVFSDDVSLSKESAQKYMVINTLQGILQNKILTSDTIYFTVQKEVNE